MKTFLYSTSNLILSLNETHLQNYKIKDKAAFRLHETKIVVIMREKGVKWSKKYKTYLAFTGVKVLTKCEGGRPQVYVT